jgi:glycosyltransferase involved in cell wall biosynthesis
MIRILRVISRMNVGGPARCVLNLTAGLKPEGFETVVAVGTPGAREGDLSGRVEVCGGKLRRIPGLKRSVAPLSDLRALAALTSLMRSFRPHIVHTHASKAGFLGRLAAQRAGAREDGRRSRIVHTFHGHVLDGYFGPLKSALYREMERRLAARSDAIVAVCDSVRRELLERHGVGRPDQYRVIPSGGQALLDVAKECQPGETDTDAGPQPEPLPGRWPEPGPGRRAVVIGRFVPIKGHEILLAALPALLDDVPDLEILLAGDGPLRSRFERAAARDPALARAMRFLGNRPDVDRILAAADFILLPSRKEGLPTVLIEAALAGVPIAAAAIPGVTDFLEDGVSALLFEPGSPPGLHAAALKLCRDSALRAGLAVEARRAAARLMSPADVVAAHADLYKKLCARA